MNPFNPRSVKDHARFDEGLRTKFAKRVFWRLRKSLGYELWSIAVEAIEDNMNGVARPNVISMVARARKARMERQWREKLTIIQENKKFALEDRLKTARNPYAKSAQLSAEIFEQQQVIEVDFAARSRSGRNFLPNP